MEPAAPNRKFVWLVLWAAFTAAPVIYYVVGSIVATEPRSAPSLPAFRTAFGVIAGLQLAAGVFLMTRAPKARGGVNGFAQFFGGEALASPEAFQGAFVLATALVEGCAILGFVLVMMGAPLTDYLLFGGGTLAAMVGVGLPTGLRYWSEREQAGAGGVPPIE